MKTVNLTLLSVAALVGFLAFRNADVTPAQKDVKADTIPYRKYDTSRIYLDPYTGDSVEIWYDPANKYYTNKRTRNRIDFYIDPMTQDTFYGEGYVVNNLLMRMPDGKYRLDSTKVKIEGNKIKYKDGSEKGKVKVEGNKIKAKDGNQKKKIKDKGDHVKVKKA